MRFPLSLPVVVFPSHSPATPLPPPCCSLFDRLFPFSYPLFLGGFPSFFLSEKPSCKP